MTFSWYRDERRLKATKVTSKADFCEMTYYCSLRPGTKLVLRFPLSLGLPESSKLFLEQLGVSGVRVIGGWAPGLWSSGNGNNGSNGSNRSRPGGCGPKTLSSCCMKDGCPWISRFGRPAATLI